MSTTTTTPITADDVPVELLVIAERDYFIKGEGAVSREDYLRRQLAAVLTEAREQMARSAQRCGLASAGHLVRAWPGEPDWDAIEKGGE
jgi:hypothetical protein